MLPTTNPHPGLRAIVDHLATLPPPPDPVWRPSWAAVTPAAGRR